MQASLVEPEPCPYRIGAVIVATIVIAGTLLSMGIGATAECVAAGGRYLQRGGVCVRPDAIIVQGNNCPPAQMKYWNEL